LNKCIIKTLLSNWESEFHNSPNLLTSKLSNRSFKLKSEWKKCIQKGFGETNQFDKLNKLQRLYFTKLKSLSSNIILWFSNYTVAWRNYFTLRVFQFIFWTHGWSLWFSQINVLVNKLRSNQILTKNLSLLESNTTEITKCIPESFLLMDLG